MAKKGYAYAIDLDKQGRMSGGVQYKTKEEAYNKGEDLVLVIPN